MATETLTHTAALSRLGYALSDETRAQVLLALRAGVASPSNLAEACGVSRQVMSNHLACLRGCGLVVATQDGRRVWYELANQALAVGLSDLMSLVLQVDPACCDENGCSCA